MKIVVPNQYVYSFRADEGIFDSVIYPSICFAQMSCISRDTEFHGLLEYITFVSLSDFFNYNYTRKLGGKTTGKSTQKNLTVKSPLKHKRSS